jgi:hypothetical protein
LSSRQLKRAALVERPPQGEQIMALDRDGRGVDQLEFVVGMLQILGVELCGKPLSWGDVRPFILLFDRLDVSKTRRLTNADLKAYVQLTELAKLERAEAKGHSQANARAQARARSGWTRAKESLVQFVQRMKRPASASMDNDGDSHPGIAWVPQDPQASASARRSVVRGDNEGRASAAPGAGTTPLNPSSVEAEL